MILGLPRRPHIGDASASAILAAVALGLLTGGLGVALVGGVTAGALAWTVESVMPDYLQLTPEDSADWLYGNLIQVELPKILPGLRRVG